MGPEQRETFNHYCSGPDCLCTRRMHVDPVGEGIVLCDYCGRAYLLRDSSEGRRMAQDRAAADTARDRGTAGTR